MLTYIDGKKLKTMIIVAANNLEKNKDEINALNVFPVPDGDTGSNMALTLWAAANEISRLQSDSIEQISNTLASASLIGARGNSGVILSQLFRGFSKELAASSEIDTKTLANAFKSASDTAYRAVMKPTEGTILTVARCGAEAAFAAAETSEDIIYVLEHIIASSQEALDKTPDMLPALKQSNVVDAGGKGLLTILEGYLAALTGQEIEIQKVQPTVAPQSTFEENADIKFSYCTEFIITKQYFDKKKLKTFKKLAEHIGDSVLIIDDETVIKVHVHSNNPGVIIEGGLKLGYLSDIKIDNMKIQHRNKIIEVSDDIRHGEKQKNSIENKKADDELVDEKIVETKKDFGVIAVSAGKGFDRILKELGVDIVIEGGQTMNPSTADFLDAIKSVSANNVFIFPNNKNIIMAANQSKELVSENVIVIPTVNMPQCIAAMVAFDETSSLSENSENLLSGYSSISSGQITFAARDSNLDGKEIRKGDILGLLENKLTSIGNNLEDVCIELIKVMVLPDTSYLTLYWGEGISEEQALEFSEKLEDIFPDLEVNSYNGGQPLYYYIVSAE